LAWIAFHRCHKFVFFTLLIKCICFIDLSGHLLVTPQQLLKVYLIASKMHAFIDSLGHPVLDLVYVAFYQRNPIDHLSVLSLLHRHRHNVLLRICLHHFDKVLTVECYVTLFIRVVVLVDVSTTVGVVI
jgi:hypothetical protein